MLLLVARLHLLPALIGMTCSRKDLIIYFEVKGEGIVQRIFKKGKSIVAHTAPKIPYGGGKAVYDRIERSVTCASGQGRYS